MLSILYQKPSTLKLNEKNPRKNDHVVDRIAASITEFGFTNPILIDKHKEIIAGHTRLKAAIKLGLKEVPTIALENLTPAQAKAYMIADNKLNELAEWDKDVLKELLHELPPTINTETLGFSQEELDRLLGVKTPDGFDESKEDDIPEDVPTIAKAKDLFTLGEHRLMCGSSTSTGDVSILMGGSLANLMFTDPPYGVSYEQGKFTGKDPKVKFRPIENDDKRGEDLYKFISEFLQQSLKVLTRPSVVYVWSPPLLPGAEILRSLVDSKIHVQSQLIWNKERLVLGRADYHWQHEICWYGYVGENHYWCGDRKQTSVWNQKKDNSYVHPTQKPVELAERAILNSSKSGDSVLDMFGGSGSTLIACEKTNRKCYTMELDPHYCDVIIARWEEVTGKKAEKIDG